MKVLVVFGTRPEAIKMCPLVKAIKKEKRMNCKVCVTGQHREMLSQVLDVFHVIPDYDLAVMKEKQTLYDITCAVMEGMRRVIKRERPELVLVHGDTTTTFAAALSCFYEKVPIGHVEAGLRTYDLYSPYPEEFNRQAVDLVAELYFTPTECTKQNLLKEGKVESKIYVTGNTAIDALKTTIREDHNIPVLEWVGTDKMILLTAHRRENWGKPLENILYAVKDVLEMNRDVKVIYPVHCNPIIRDSVQRILGEEDRVKLIPPLNVVDFHNLINKSYLILTDSGGIQEEAPSLGKPVLVLRNTTERPEGIAAGTLKLIGTDRKEISKNVNQLLNNVMIYESMSKASNPYGDGFASERIVSHIIEWERQNGSREKGCR